LFFVSHNDTTAPAVLKFELFLGDYATETCVIFEYAVKPGGVLI
jgi:hypothetical protein